MGAIGALTCGMALVVSALLALALSLPDRGAPPWRSLGQLGLLFNLVAMLALLTAHIHPQAAESLLHPIAALDVGMGFASILAGIRRRRETASAA